VGFGFGVRHADTSVPQKWKGGPGSRALALPAPGSLPECTAPESPGGICSAIWPA
jgi:hypothetical protein